MIVREYREFDHPFKRLHQQEIRQLKDVLEIPWLKAKGVSEFWELDGKDYYWVISKYGTLLAIVFK